MSSLEMSGISLPLIQVKTPERMKKQTVFVSEITDLLNEVRQLHVDTDSLVCNCNQPDCPFQESYSLDIQQIKSSFDFSTDFHDHRHRRKESSPLRGVERRNDGTIVEKDGPRTPGVDSLEKRLSKSYSSSSYGLSTYLSVSTLSDSEDCSVDSDNLFGTSSDDDSTFSRFEPTRKLVRRNNSRSPKLQKRRATLIPASSTFPTSQMDELRKSSLGSSQTLPQYSRNATSLPFMAYLEDDAESQSTCSSNLNTMQQIPCHTYPQQHNELYWE